MDQNSKIQYYNNQYNSMFDDYDSTEEIKDSANDSHEKLKNWLNKKENPQLFHCILNMMNDHDIPHESNKYLTQKELDKITTLFTNDFGISYFKKFNPENGDYSIIFKYLRKIKMIDSSCFDGCYKLREINIPNSVIHIGIYFRHLGSYSFAGCKNLTKIIIPNSVSEIAIYSFSNCYNLQELTIPKRFKHNIKKIFQDVDLSKVKITYI